jgi:RNA polymerase sigma-70 factor (ECF subfamily)
LAGESEAWRQWLRQHGAALFLFARQWTANHADAEDAVQMGFLKFWQWRSRAADQLAYLYSCVRSAALDQGRTDRRRSAREKSAAHGEELTFDFPVERGQRQEMIEAALGQLPADQREVVVLKIWAGLTFAQIADALNIPLNTAASRYRYALIRLEKELSEEVAHD